MSKRDLTRLTQQEAAELAGVTARAFRDWVGCPRNPDGTYSGPEVVAWLVRRAGGTGEYDDERERLAAAQADKVEMDNAVRRGQLADMAETEREWSDMIVAAKSKLLGIPTKDSPQLVNIADANIIAALLRASLHAALSELADYRPQVDAEQPSADPAEGVQGVGPAAPANGKRVGGHKPKVKQRK